MTDYPPPPGPGYPQNPAEGSGVPQPPTPQPPAPQQPGPQYPAAPQGPYQGVPQQPVPQYPGVPQAQYQGAPQAAYQQGVPAAPGPFLAGLGAMWKSSLDIWKGQPDQAVRRSKEVVYTTGTSWAYWLPTFVIVTAVQFILTLLLLLTSGAGGQAVVGALLAALFTFGMLCLASLAIMVAHRTVGSNATYSQSATSYALGNAFWLWATIPTSLITMLISGFSLGVIWLMGIVLIYSVFMAVAGMVVIYLSAREDTPQQTSILLPLFAYIFIVYGVAYLLLISIIYSSVSSYMGGLFNPFY